MKNENIIFSIYKAKIGKDMLCSKKVSCIFLEVLLKLSKTIFLVLLKVHREVQTQQKRLTFSILDGVIYKGYLKVPAVKKNEQVK